MPLIINTNVLAQTVQQNLARSSGTLAQSLQRLSSGLRINSAKDDAAGMAIAEGLSTIIRGGNQAVRNANDGISLSQVAESALGQISGNLQRIREIAIQAANGSMVDSNRSQLQKEVDQLTQEISRTVQTTDFNGSRLLSGASTLTFQVGYSGSGDNRIQVSTTDLAQSLGSPSPAAKASSAILGAVQGGSSPLAAITAADQALRKFVTSGLTTTVGSNTYNVSGFTSGSPAQNAAWATYQAAEAAYNANVGAKPAVVLAAMNNAAANAAAGYGWVGAGTGLYSYYQSMTATGTINITNQALAAAAVGSVDADIAKIANLRATFGSVQNRFEAVVANVQAYVENSSAARSRITDADFAEETARLTRHQILQQAGTAVLGQANTAPSTALRLLR
ncbi:flagellin [Azospira oryzae]|uniref:flagellin N-terminal helical domain-containing protein n=1 Tax=Azospira oryzae TaxID=146939 RepID=UPI00196640BE|nr:flagellin [Azospira oryzae]